MFPIDRIARILKCATNILALLMLLPAISAPVFAADKSSMGVNSMFIMEYAASQGVPCRGCPENIKARTIDEIEGSIKDLVRNQHVRAFREIVSLQLLSPNGVSNPEGVQMPQDSTNYAVIDRVMNLFRENNIHLIFAIGNPVPDWAAPWQKGYGCFLPPPGEAGGEAKMLILKNNISWTVGNYLNHLKQSGYGDWMAGGPLGASGLFVEGFNEWNANQSPLSCHKGDDNKDTSGATPQRAALVQQGIGWVADFYGVSVQMAAPSVVFPPGGLSGWYSAYYLAGGIGAPNVHIYSRQGNSAAQAIDDVEAQLENLKSSLPAPHDTQIILGETGFAEAVDGCSGNTSLTTEEFSKYHKLVAELLSDDNPKNLGVKTLTIWRLDRLPIESPEPCESNYGIVSQDLKTYHPAGIKFFQYLGGTGNSPDWIPTAGVISLNGFTVIPSGWIDPEP